MGRRENLQVKDDRLREALEGKRYLVIDGAMGTVLMREGFEVVNSHPDLLNLTDPEAVTAILSAYVDAGADIVTTNTFGTNARNLAGVGDVAEVFAAAVKCARASGASYVAADIGPSGALMAPYGELGFEDAYGLFAEEARAGAAAGCDLFIVETMTDLLEAKAAVLAVTENTDLPLVATMTFNDTGTTLMGTTPQIAAATLAQLGADVVGMNCSLGPDQVAGIARELNETSPVPVAVQPNAGLPETVDGKHVYKVHAADYVESYRAILDSGTRFVGSCCGSDPDFTRGLAGLVRGKDPAVPLATQRAFVTSARKAAPVPDGGVAGIAEVVNPDGAMEKLLRKLKRCKAPVAGIELAGISEDGAAELAEELEGYAGVPLWFKTDDAQVAETLARPYAGCPALGSGTGPASAELARVAARYGCPLATR